MHNMYHVGKITKKCNHPSVSDRSQASRMDMASLLAAQQLLAGSGASSLSASQQQQLVGKNREIKAIIFLTFSVATNEQQFATVVGHAAAAIAGKVLIFVSSIFMGCQAGSSIIIIMSQK